MLALGERLVYARACGTRDSPELSLLNLRRMLQNAAGSGDVVERGDTKIPSSATVGAASVAAASVTASRVTASARTCDRTAVTTSLCGHQIEDRFLQSGYSRCDSANDCDRHHVMLVLTPLQRRCTCCAAQQRAALHCTSAIFAKCGCSVWSPPGVHPHQISSL